MRITEEVGTLNLTNETFALFCALIHKETGIFMRESKKVLVANRIRRRVVALGLGSYEEYYRLLTGGGAAGEEEKGPFKDAVSTNETYFFRGDSHYDALRTVVLPELFHRKNSIRLWSAGCSTGEEPYTICMVIIDAALGHWNGSIHVEATDISTEAVRKAQEGVYAGRTLQRVSRGVLEQHFEQVSGDNWRVAPRVREMVSFRVHNLLTEEPPGRGFEIIFCRNVMIYFDRETQTRLVDGSFASALDPGGYLFIGHAESLIGKSRRFRYAQILRSPIYRPVLEGARDG